MLLMESGADIVRHEMLISLDVESGEKSSMTSTTTMADLRAVRGDSGETTT